MKRIKTTIRNRMETATLDQLMRIANEGPKPEEFNFDKAADLWGSIRQRINVTVKFPLNLNLQYCCDMYQFFNNHLTCNSHIPLTILVCNMSTQILHDNYNKILICVYRCVCRCTPLYVCRSSKFFLVTSLMCTLPNMIKAVYSP